MEVVAQQSSRDNLEQAFEIAESLGVTRLLDAEGTKSHPTPPSMFAPTLWYGVGPLLYPSCPLLVTL